MASAAEICYHVPRIEEKGHLSVRFLVQTRNGGCKMENRK